MLWGNQKVNAQKRRYEDYTQTLLQLGAYICILALLALAGRAVLADVSARAARQPAATVATQVEPVKAEPASAVVRTERLWLDGGQSLDLRGALASP